MRPPKGLRFEIQPATAEDRARNEVRVKVTAEEVVHLCPPRGSGLMPCCERTPFEVPRWHRMTLDSSLVTCTNSGSPGGGS